VAAVTRVGDYLARAVVAGHSDQMVRFLAVDRLSFPNVAWFRDDLADDSLGGLMNRLASREDGILMSQAALDESSLRVGDQLKMYVDMGDGYSVDGSFTIVGAYRNFPTVYADKITVVGNIEHLFGYFGAEMPHGIWARLKPGASGEAALSGLTSLGLQANSVADAPALIEAEQAKLERVGIFGTLSLGFLAAAVMAFAGLLINTYASLNERIYRFTVLHAMGLRRRQILGQVLLEYGFLTAFGAAMGGLIGAGTAHLFAPFFRLTGVREVALPPLLPVIAQDQIVTLTTLFAVAMIVLELSVIATALYRRLFRMLAMRYRA
jgi:putative ABC transport system permease protein